MLAWFNSQGGSCLAEAVTVEQGHGSKGGHTLRASAMIPKGTVIITIPDSLFVTTDCVDFASLDAPASYGGDTDLYEAHYTALSLLVERSKGDASRFAPYIASLPPAVSDYRHLLPLWSAEEVAQLQVYELRQEALQASLELRELYKLCFRPLVHAHAAATGYAPAKDADELAGPLFGSPDLPAASQLDTCPGFEDYLWAMSVMETRAFDLSTKEFATEDGTAPVSTALLPFLHLANHKQPGESNAFFSGGGSEGEESSIEVRTSCEVLPGQEICLCYYDMSDRDSLMDHGFIGTPMRGAAGYVDESAGGAPVASLNTGYSHRIRIRSPLVEPSFYAFCHEHSSSQQQQKPALAAGAAGAASSSSTAAAAGTTDGADAVMLRMHKFKEAKEEADAAAGGGGGAALEPFVFRAEAVVPGSDKAGILGETRDGDSLSKDQVALAGGKAVVRGAMGLGEVPVYSIEIGVLPEDFEDNQPDPSGKVDMLLSEITSPLNGGTSVADDLAMLKGGLDQPDALSENLRLAVLYRYREKCVLAWLKKWASDFQAQFDAAAEDA